MDSAALEGENPQGPCIKCGYEDELDADGLCASCNPVSPETIAAVKSALSIPKEASASEIK